ncbi:MAG TPA: enoyl-CoA hydratase-related protein [Bacteriovoracaceae bacterium]|nr:enoyl-CoA hydratase-related protein [Bacteriovoracaceae bacterium]
MKDFENILVTKNYQSHPHIGMVQLNRPTVLNALSTALLKEVLEAFFMLEDDSNIRVIILTGNDKAFAAGSDIGQIAEASAIDQLKDTRSRIWKQFALITKPVIAAVNGFALGGGCELAMSCDFIIAGDSARFGQPEIKLGTIPGAGGTQRLTRAIGKSKAMLAVLTGDMMDAYEAEKSGLVAKVVPAETLLQETMEIAKLIANRAPVAVKLAKEAVNMAFETSLGEGMEYERRNFYLTFASRDQKEGMKAFMEKREPKYQGN